MAPRKGRGRSGRRGRRTSKRNEQEEGTEKQASGSADGATMPDGPLTAEESAELDVIKEVLDIEVDGEWQEQTMGVAFTRLEKMMQRILTRDGERGTDR